MRPRIDAHARRGQPGQDGRASAAPGHAIFFQYASVRELCEPVEAITGRKVRAFISGIDTEADGLVTELFVFHPEGYEGPSRIERAEP